MTQVISEGDSRARLNQKGKFHNAEKLMPEQFSRSVMCWSVSVIEDRCWENIGWECVLYELWRIKDLIQ